MIQRLFRIGGWLALAFIAYATVSPIEARPVLAPPHFEHFAAFALLGLAFGLGYSNRTFIVFAIVLGCAFGLEAMQLLTSDRHGRVIDAVVKALGGVCGITVSQLARLSWRHLQSRPPDIKS